MLLKSIARHLSLSQPINFLAQLNIFLTMVALWVWVAIAFGVIGLILSLYWCSLLDLHSINVRSGRSTPRKYLRWTYSTRSPPVEHQLLPTFRNVEDSDTVAGNRGSVETLPKYEEPPPANLARESA